VYRPLALFRRGFELSRAIFRDHRKILVVDGRIGFTGGINIADAWLPRDGSRPWRDDALAVVGPAVSELELVFARTWRALSNDRRRPLVRLGRASGRVYVLANRLQPRARRAIRGAYVRAARSAQRTIDLAAAYFLPGPRLLSALAGAARRGVRVRVIVPERSDMRVVDFACSSLLGKLLRAGVHVYLFQERILHSKTALFDERLVTIGSHNLDSLSWRFNLECNLVVEDEALGTIVARSFAADVAASRELSFEAWRDRPWWVRWLARFGALFRGVL
jgi:cardiolipin synthase